MDNLDRAWQQLHREGYPYPPGEPDVDLGVDESERDAAAGFDRAGYRRHLAHLEDLARVISTSTGSTWRW